MSDEPSPGGLDTASLIGLLTRLATRMPGDADEVRARSDGLRTARSLLLLRGIDPEPLIRHGIGLRLLSTLRVWLIAEASLIETSGRPHGVDLGQWRRALRIPEAVAKHTQPEETPSLHAADHFIRIELPLSRWLAEAPLDDVLNFTAPSDSTELSGYSLRPPPPEAVITAYRWLYQRMAVERLDRWDTESLMLEFGWIETGRLPPAPIEVMDERQIDLNEVCYEFTSRTRNSTHGSPEVFDELLAQLQSQAVTFLNQGRHREAIALFEFYLEQNPSHLIAENNLAFAMIPEDPASALHHLQQLERRGYVPRSVNIHNQMVCLRALGKNTLALEKSDYYWQHEKAETRYDAYLWALGDEGLEIASLWPNTAVARLALDIAKAVDDEAQMARWTQRME